MQNQLTLGYGDLNLDIMDISQWSFIVKGLTDVGKQLTKKYKEDFKKLGAKWENNKSKNLGWCWRFSKKKSPEFNNLIIKIKETEMLPKIQTKNNNGIILNSKTKTKVLLQKKNEEVDDNIDYFTPPASPTGFTF